MSLTDREQRQRESVQSLRLSEARYEQLRQYAEDNALSVSEAMREMIERYTAGEVPNPVRKRRSRRVSIWVSPTLWSAFRRRADRDKISYTDAIEAALEAHL